MDDEEQDEDGNPIVTRNNDAHFTPNPKMAVNNNPRNPSGPVTPLKLKLGGSANNQMAPPASGASGDQQAYLHYQQQQLKKLEEENMRIRKEQMEKRHQS